MKHLSLVSLLVSVLAIVGVLGFYANTPAPESPQVGAVSGPDSTFDCETHNGIKTCFTKKAFTVATTTICAIKSPNATSTLARGLVRFQTSTTSATVITLAQATTAFATTTLNGGQVAIAAGLQQTIQASTTGAATIFAPNTYFVVGMQGGAGTFSPTGFCQATFEAI